MSKISRITLICQHADGTVREYRADKNPAGLTLRFTDDGDVMASSTPANPVFVTVMTWPARKQRP
jgi:hypothetical protein